MFILHYTSTTKITRTGLLFVFITTAIKIKRAIMLNKIKKKYSKGTEPLPESLLFKSVYHCNLLPP